jgi:FAD/FMN-containing dehydrogenase
VDGGRGLLEVQAHTRWLDVAEQLRPGDARAQSLLAARATVGGTLAWNGAGPDGRPAVAHVESLTMVTPDGHLRRIDRTTGGALFALTLGGQGLFGALYSATLRIESLLRAILEPQPQEHLAPESPREAARRLRLLLPPAAVDSFLAEARGRCAGWGTAIAGVTARRTRDEEETFLRWAQREYSQLTLWLHERPTLGGAVRCTQLRRELIDAALARGGAFPIACTPEATREQTEACYPQLADFLAEQRRIDPGGVMANAWLRHQRSLLSRQPCAVRWAKD